MNKWLNGGGSLRIEFLEDGSQIWKYTNIAGDTVPYSPQLINGEWVKAVDFSNYLHPDNSIASFSIGEFTNREADYAVALEYLKSMGYSEVPAGYVVHHSTVNGIIQLVEEAIHSEFSHYGGVHFYE